MAKDVTFEVAEKGPTLQIWINDLVSIQFRSVEEMGQFAQDLINMVPEIMDTQAAR